MRDGNLQMPMQVTLEKVNAGDIAAFRAMVEQYWQELMPHAEVVKDLERRNGYFDQCFAWDGGNCHPYWAVCDEHRIGFVSFEVTVANKSACVHDLYVSPPERRNGFGSALVRALYQHFDMLQVELIELNVRRDNPNALRFWEALGFRIALYRLRQYRDPKTSTGFIGALSSDFAEDDNELVV